MYWSLEESPVSGRMTALIVDGREDILEVLLWKGRVRGCWRELAVASRRAVVLGLDAKAIRERDARRAGLDMNEMSADVFRVL